MHKYDQVIAALDDYCSDREETLEAREQRLNAPSAPIRQALTDPKGVVLNRNIKLILFELQIGTEEFRPYLEGRS